MVLGVVDTFSIPRLKHETWGTRILVKERNAGPSASLRMTVFDRLSFAFCELVWIVAGKFGWCVRACDSFSFGKLRVRI